MSARRFRVNTPDVVHEIIEGEAVIVNLGNGMYYSVDRAGADIWALIEHRATVPEIVARLGERFAADQAAIGAGVDQFIDQLLAESLIVPEDSDVGATGDLPPPAHGAFRPPFEAPSLQRYTDMEDLLLLDPIHDADEQE